MSALVLALGTLTWIGAAAGAPVLRSIVPGWPQMATSTALCFMLGGLAIVLVTRAQRLEAGRIGAYYAWARASGACVLAISGTTLAAFIGGWTLPWQEAPTVASGATSTPRMAPATAIGFLVLGSAMLVLHERRWIILCQFLCITGILVGWLGVSRYVYGGQTFAALFAMSLNTALAFIVLGVGLLLTRVGDGLVALLCAPSQGGAMMRRLLPCAILLPIVIGWIRLEAQHAGWFGTESGLLLFTMANITIFGALIWLNSRRLHRIDSDREHLAAQARHMAAVVQSSNDAIVSKSIDGVITSWNDGAKRLYGYASDETVGRKMSMLLPPELMAEEEDILRRIASGQIVDHSESIRRHKDGRTVCVSMTVSPIRDASGRIIGASNISHDISARKLAERKMAEHLARLDLLRQVTKSVSEHQDLPSIYQVVVRYLEERLPIDFACVCLYDRNTHALTVSRVGVKSLDLATSLAMTENAIIPIDRNGLSRCVAGELVYEPDISTVDFPFPRRLVAGGIRSFVAAPLLVESMVAGVIIACRRAADGFSSGDCEFLHQLSEHVSLATRHAELYTALQRAYDDIRLTQQAVMQHERLRALGQMASGIAHDINNALTPVVIYAEQLLEREKGLSDRARHTIEMILRAGEDVSSTIGRLREFYRPLNKQEMTAGMDLNALVHQVVDLTRAQWQDDAHQRGISVQIDLQLADGLPFVIGKDSEIREALTNLMLNALDAMPSGGSITLRTQLVESDRRLDGSPGGRLARLEIADTGIGMDEQTKRRCLEPFFTTKGERGTGLGLAMVYGIIQRHGADLTVESAVNQGTKFQIDFHGLTHAITLTSQEVADLPVHMRLLLIDDDPIILKALSDSLGDEGHELTLANGGQAGIDAFQSSMQSGRAYDVVITDLGMPIIDGRRVAAAIKAISPTTPVIMLTGWGQRLTHSGELPPHVDRLLNKPPKIRELRQTLAQLVKKA